MIIPLTLLKQEEEAIVKHYAEDIRLECHRLAAATDKVNRSVFIAEIENKLARLKEFLKLD